MGQCNSKQQVLHEEHSQPIKVTTLHIDNVGDSATSNSTAHKLAKYLAENPLDFRSKSQKSSTSGRRTRTRRSVLRDSAAAPVGADMNNMSCSSTMNLSSSCLRLNTTSLEMSSANMSLGNSNTNNNNSHSYPTRRQSGGGGGMEFLDLSSSHGGGGQLDPLPEEMPTNNNTPQEATATSEAMQNEDIQEKRSSSGSSSIRRKSSNRNSSSSSSITSSRRSSQKAPHPAMDVSPNERVLKKENSKKNMNRPPRNKSQSRPKRQARRSVSETAATTARQKQFLRHNNNKQDSVRQSLQVTDLDRSKLGTGKDSSWQGLSCTSGNSYMYESYENSGNSLMMMSQPLRFQPPPSSSSSTQQQQGDGGDVGGGNNTVMDLSRMEKDAMANMHGFCFTESEDEDDDDESSCDDEEEQQDAAAEEGVCNIHVTVRIE